MDGKTPEGAVSPWLVPVTLMPQYSLSAHEGPGEIAPPGQEALPVCRYPRCMSIPAVYPPRTRHVPMQTPSRVQVLREALLGITLLLASPRR